MRLSPHQEKKKKNVILAKSSQEQSHVQGRCWVRVVGKEDRETLGGGERK